MTNRVVTIVVAVGLFCYMYDVSDSNLWVFSSRLDGHLLSAVPRERDVPHRCREKLASRENQARERGRFQEVQAGVYYPGDTGPQGVHFCIYISVVSLLRCRWVLLPLTPMFVPQQRDSGRLFHHLPADDHQRHGILFHTRPDPHHPPERDGMRPHPLPILPVGQEARPRPFYSRVVSCSDGRVRPAHRDEDFVGPIRWGCSYHGRSRAVCRDAAIVGGRELCW